MRRHARTSRAFGRLSGLLLLGLSGTAMALPIIEDIEIDADSPVAISSFYVTSQGFFDVRAIRRGPVLDPYLYLFSGFVGDLTRRDLIAEVDDQPSRA